MEKRDIYHTLVKLVYGEDFRLPGQFAAPGPRGYILAFLPALRQAKAYLHPTSPRLPLSHPIHFPADFCDATTIFLRTGATTGPLQPPYTGPYCVLHQSKKYVPLEIKSHLYVASWDRMKAAHLPPAQPASQG
ncbi:hypothetical protein E2C01_026422 [Portunus trituberculatus]|uniref:Uncharacterized protein n=1 Tax=Portunus trituberculatus TaxID=210409 RepID=A0A5B7EFW5_PORTR|nr:hypothetical protein [Portunus trituberculatus]